MVSWLLSLLLLLVVVLVLLYLLLWLLLLLLLSVVLLFLGVASFRRGGVLLSVVEVEPDDLSSTSISTSAWAALPIWIAFIKCFHAHSGPDTYANHWINGIPITIVGCC